MERKPKEHEMDREVSVRLTDSEIIERAQNLAAKIEHVKILRRKRREDLRSANALIESELDEVERLARVIGSQEELRKQGELFAQDTAVGVLGELGRRESGTGEVLPASAPPLADHDIDAEAAAEAGAGEEDVDDGDEDDEDDEEDEDDDVVEAGAEQMEAGPRSVRSPRGPLKRARRRSPRR